jgi:D-inositol-3-phosphate glycosyltransferase
MTEDAPAASPEPPPFHGCVDWPQEGTVVAPPLLEVEGWSTHDALERIEVAVDGIVTLARPVARPRPDVHAATGSPYGLLSGFHTIVDIGDRALGERVTVDVTVVCEGGVRRHLGSASVTVGPRPSPVTVDVRDVERIAATTKRLVASHRAEASSHHHVLFVTHQLDLGGGQLYLQDLVLGLLTHHGVQCTVVSQSDGLLRPELEAAGADVCVVGPYAIDPRGYERTVRDLALLAMEVGATATIANTAGAFCAIDAAGRLGIPALWAIHESYTVDRFLTAAYGAGAVHPFVADRFRSALATAQAVLFEAAQTRDLYSPHGDPRRFVHLPYGVPLAAIDAYRADVDRAGVRAAHGFDPSDEVLLCMGTIEERKAQGALVRAFTAVAPEHPNAVLALVGHRGDAYGDFVRQYAEHLGLSDRVRVEPVTPDVYDWYALADVFILVSDVESLPRSVLEAMAFELPVLATDIYGLSDTIDDGRTGLLVPPRDMAAYEDGLRCLLEMSHLARAEMGAAAARRMRAHHDSRAYVAAYRRLLDGFARDPDDLPLSVLAG